VPQRQWRQRARATISERQNLLSLTLSFWLPASGRVRWRDVADCLVVQQIRNEDRWTRPPRLAGVVSARALGPEDAFCRLLGGISPLRPDVVLDARKALSRVKPDWVDAWPWSEGEAVLEQGEVEPVRYDAAMVKPPKGSLAPRVFACLIQGPRTAEEIATELRAPLRDISLTLVVGQRAGWSRRLEPQTEARWRIKVAVRRRLRHAQLSPLGLCLLSRPRHPAVVSSRLASIADAQVTMALRALQDDPELVTAMATEWPMVLPKSVWTPFEAKYHRLRMDLAIWTPRSEDYPTIDIEQETSLQCLNDRVRSHVRSALTVAAISMAHVELWFTYRSKDGVRSTRIERAILGLPTRQPVYRGSATIGLCPLSAAMERAPWNSPHGRVIVEPPWKYKVG